jgi:hypothetical protein
VKTLNPALGLSAALVYLAVCAALAVGLALQAPWMGLSLKAQGSQVQVVAARGPSAGIEPGSRLLALSTEVGGTRQRIDLAATDLAEEPDMVDD